MFWKFCWLQRYLYFSNFTTFDTLYISTTFSNPKIKCAPKENGKGKKEKKNQYVNMSINLLKE